jgi:hypothetical protein
MKILSLNPRGDVSSDNIYLKRRNIIGWMLIRLTNEKEESVAEVTRRRSNQTIYNREGISFVEQYRVYW